MTVTQDAVGRRVVLSPQEGLVAGGPAEEFEQRVQALFRNGSTDLLVDLRRVPTIDSRGVRALVRAHTSAQRLGATFRIACPCSAVRAILEVSKLDSVFVVYDTMDAAQKRDLRWDLVWTALAGGALCAALVAGGLRWPLAGNPDAAAAALPTGSGGLGGALAPQPFIALIKLVAAALIGMLVTAIHAPNAADRPTGRAMQHAQILLCVSGAMMMIIIGDSLARAFGIAGAASIVRFRTPVEDPKDVTIIFLLMSLGMACGLGAFAVAGLGAAFLCVFLYLLDRTGVRRSRALAVEVIAEGRDFPTDHVHGVFARNRIVFETREVSQGKETGVTYHALIDPNLSLDDVSAQLMAGGSAGVRSVSWEQPKKGF
jgi:anti-anti-sigma factor